MQALRSCQAITGGVYRFRSGDGFYVELTMFVAVNRDHTDLPRPFG